ncbi:MAG: GYF domain-containing protein [Deltaproteobacteria bacterium]|nr:GYF domain-containing protein [Deltaproteobacteria bacterium]
MKIVCEACGAKYSISDDKVRGKVFKIRCKKCSHIIVVRGNEDGVPMEAEPSASADLRAQHSAEAPAAEAEAVWYVVVEGEQVGPLTEADVAARVSRGEITGETFAWREGMADWIQVSAIAEFANSLAAAPPSGGGDDADSPFAPQPTAVYPPGTAESIFGDPADVTPAPQAQRPSGGRSEATEVFGAPTAIGKPPAGQDLFAPQAMDAFSAPAPTAVSPVSHHMAPVAAPVSSGGGFFPVSAPSPASAGAGAGLTGQRSENSVLFSLSNLESLAGSGSPSISSAPLSSGRGLSAAPAPVTEGSGLIDIRSMAAMTLGKQTEQPSMFGGMPMSAPELPTFSAAPIAPLAPMMLPTRQSSGVPPYVWALVVLVVVALAGLSYMILRPTPLPPAPVVVAAPPAPVPAAPAEPPPTPQAAPAAAAPVKEEALPPREEAVVHEKATSKKPSSGSTGSKKPATTAKADPEPTKAEPAPKAEPKVEAPAPAKKGSLDDLLAGAIGGAPKKAPAPAASPTPAAEPAKKAGPLGKSDIVKGMMGVMPKTKACYDQYKVPGTANVNIKVDPSGRVDSADVTGKFAGTPTGECVEKAVKTARFPASDGLTFPYPIPLR